MEARCRALTAAARWKGQAHHSTTGVASANSSQPLAPKLGITMASRNTGTVSATAVISRGRMLFWAGTWPGWLPSAPSDFVGQVGGAAGQLADMTSQRCCGRRERADDGPHHLIGHAATDDAGGIRRPGLKRSGRRLRAHPVEQGRGAGSGGLGLIGAGATDDAGSVAGLLDLGDDLLGRDGRRERDEGLLGREVDAR